MEPNDKKNPLIQGDHSSIAVKELHNNVDNHTDSHDTISTTNNNNTVNQNSTVVYNGIAATEKLLSQRRQEYRVFCEKNIVSPIINLNTRVQLDEMASRLQLEKSVTEEIERSVRMKLSTTGSLSKNDRITLDIAVEALNADAGKEIVDKLVVLAGKTEDEDVQFYANLSLAVYDFRRCIQRYETKTFDSYWQTFWAYFAYKRSGNNQKAEIVLTHLAAWSDYPEDQVTMLSGAGCLYDYFASNGSESLKRTAIGYLKSCISYSPLLIEFSSVLVDLTEHERPLYLGNDKARNLYLRLFGAKDMPAVSISPKSLSSPTPKSIGEPEAKNQSVYEVAHQANKISPSPVSVSKPQNVNTVTSKPTYTVSPSSSDNKFSWLKYAIGGLVVAGALYFIFRPEKSDENIAIENPDEQIEVVVDGSDSGQQLSEGYNNKNNSKSQNSGHSQVYGNDKSDNRNSSTENPNTSSGRNVADGNNIKNTANSQESSSGDNNTEVGGSSTSITSPKPTVSELQKQLDAFNSGNVAAACKLGHMYLDGNGVEKSNATAFSYFKKAADAGNAEGMYWLGWCYRMGRGTKKNLDQAKFWWTRAAAAGHARAAEDVKEFDTLM